jgi:4-amino-4-deoxy-L-arabinose transferase-like glycosyltransferase
VLVLTAVALFVVLPGVAGSASGYYALGFADDYDILANSLATGRGYRLAPQLEETMMREPGYPLLLAGVFKALGYHLWSARLANLLLAGGAALLLWHLAMRVTRDDKVALLATLAFLLHPGTVVAQARGGVEILFVFGLLGFLLLVYRAIEADRHRLFFLAGLALGAVVLVRSTPLLFPLLLVPYLVATATSESRLRRLAQGGVLFLGMATVMLPWVARNYMLSGHLVPTASVQGVAAQEGQYTCERLSFGRSFEELQHEAAAERQRIAAALGFNVKSKTSYYQYFHTVAQEHAFNGVLLERSFARYREDPALLARCAAGNVLHFWFLGKNGLATAINMVLQLPLLALAFIGLRLLWRSAPLSAWAPIALFIGYIWAVHMPVIAHARHSIPLVPLLAIFAATALMAAWQRLKDHRLARATRPVGA